MMQMILTGVVLISAAIIFVGGIVFMGKQKKSEERNGIEF